MPTPISPSRTLKVYLLFFIVDWQAAAVRDMVAIADYLDGPDKPINYWGFSYGTIIGSYFINSAFLFLFLYIFLT